MKYPIGPRALLFAAICSTAAFVASPVADPAASGTFNATVSGAVSAQFSGAATSMGRAGDGWNAQLQTPNGDSSILLVTDGSGRPTPQAYTIVDMEEHGGNAPTGQYTALVALAGGSVGGPIGFGSITGTLTIDASSPGEVTGRFNFSARDASDSTRIVTVDGTFTTTNQDIS